MSDSPADTMIFGEAMPAHRIRPARPWGLWFVAALLAMLDALLFLVLITR